MKRSGNHGSRRPFLVLTRAPSRSLAVIVAPSGREACRRVVTHLRHELRAPRCMRRLRAVPYRSSRLPRHLPAYDDSYFTDPPWNT
jgi:hypothetical protein